MGIIIIVAIIVIIIFVVMGINKIATTDRNPNKGNQLKIIYESAKIIEDTANYETFYSRVKLIVAEMDSITDFNEDYLDDIHMHYIALLVKCNSIEESYKNAFESGKGQTDQRKIPSRDKSIEQGFIERLPVVFNQYSPLF